MSLLAGAAVVITSSITLQHKTKEIKLFDNVIEAISMFGCNEVKKVFVTKLDQPAIKNTFSPEIPDCVKVYLLETVGSSNYLPTIYQYTGHT